MTGYIYNRLRHPFGYRGSLGLQRLNQFRDIDDLAHPIFDLFGVKFFYIDTTVSGPLESNDMRSKSLLVNRDTLPLLRAVKSVKLFNTYAEVLEAVSKGSGKMKDVVYLVREDVENHEMLFGDFLGVKQHIGSAVNFNSIVYGGSKIGFTVTCSENTLIILSEPWLPPWRATVDGKSAKIYQAYGLIQAVLVPKGTHFVRFEYTFPVYLIVISAIAQILILFLSVMWLKKGRRKFDLTPSISTS